jgi:hypothetical protein
VTMRRHEDRVALGVIINPEEGVSGLLPALPSESGHQSDGSACPLRLLADFGLSLTYVRLNPSQRTVAGALCTNGLTYRLAISSIIPHISNPSEQRCFESAGNET